MKFTLKKIALIPSIIAYLFFCSSVFAQTITTGNQSGTYCVNSELNVSYTITGNFNSDNIFTVQLSDASGNFGSPVNIGSVASTASGTLVGTLPSGTPAGSGYKIRVVSSDPALTGTVTTSTITIAGLTATTFQNNYGLVGANTYYEGARAVTQLADGNFLALGYGLNLLKLDPYGNVIWAKQLYDQHAGGPTFQGNEIRQTADGGFIIAAQSYYNGGYFGGVNYILLIKTDAQGNTQWSYAYGNSNVGGDSGGGIGTEPTSIRQTSDGGYIVSATTSAYGYYWDGVGGHPVFIKIDATGNVKWTKIFTEYDVNTAWIRSGIDVSEIPDSSGDLMIWGCHYPWNCCSGPYDVNGVGGYLMRTHADGTVVWSKKITGPVNSSSTNMAAYNGGFYLGVAHGFSVSGSISGGGVIKVDFNGNLRWSRVVNTNEYVQSIAATVDSNGNDNGVIISHGMLNYDAGIVKLDSSGAMQWGEDYSSGGGAAMEFAMDVVQTTDGGYLIEGDAGAYASGTGLILVKTDKNGIAGGTETAMTYTSTDAGCTVSTYLPTIISDTTSSYPACINTSTFNPVVTSYTSGGGTCTMHQVNDTSNSCDAIIVVINLLHSVSCNTDSNGSVTAIVTGGHTPYTYKWNTGQGTDTLTRLTSGNYTVTATDSTGITATASLMLNASGTIAVTVTGGATVCSGQGVTLTATGATSYSWLPTTALDTTADSIVIARPVSTTTYTVTGISGGCSDTASATVTILPADTAGTISAPHDTVCAGTPVALTVNGSSGSLQWQSSPDGAEYISLSGDTQTVLSMSVAAGAYYRVIASGGCADTSLAFKLSVDTVPVPVLSTADSIFCSSDSTRINSSGPYATYSWSNADTRPYTYATQAGGYWLTVSDFTGCTAESNHLAISVYPVPSVSITVQGDTLTSFGQSNYQWLYNNNAIPGAIGALYIAHQSGSYALQVTDSNGCTTTSTAVPVTTGISDISEERISIYPNPNSVGNWQLAVDNDLLGAKLEVYDEQGRIVFQSKISLLKSKIDLDVSSGVYYLRISNDSVSVVRKLVKL